MNAQQFEKIRSGAGFVAALDQSGGSTPNALRLYGIEESAYSSEQEMFALVHQMRSRIITSPSFDGNRVLGAILFQDTMYREIDGRSSVDYLWNVKGVVPFLKIDDGLADAAEGAQVMRPVPDLEDRLAGALDHGVLGTKIRSVITLPGPGLDAVVEQQFSRLPGQFLRRVWCPSSSRRSRSGARARPRRKSDSRPLSSPSSTGWLPTRWSC
ncbi:class I fructose-bisphosphate aldolase [Georgenia sp. AZ-5]|uniref:class I fructose-bisphosphate aldolase n=1 Tax=Georgenia sp. AZ-5 TaxID=3367526 RepID=UPI0037550A81